MGMLGKDLASDLRAVICDLDSVCMKQVLFAIVEDLMKRPSVLMDRFVELVLDGSAYQKCLKDLRLTRGEGIDRI